MICLHKFDKIAYISAKPYAARRKKPFEAEMKKTISVILILALCLGCILSISSCKKKYERADSTEEEARVVMSLTVGDEVYEVRYELYRTLFLTYRAVVDKGSSDVWTGEDSEKYVDEINDMIIKRLSGIFSVFELARRIGFDPYSDEAEDEIDEMIRISVEGGSRDGVEYGGYGGDYDAYRAALKSMYHNDSTSVLMLRYELAREAVYQYYLGNGADGAIEYTESDIETYYYSDSAARILKTYITEGVSYDTEARAESVKEALKQAAASGETAVRAVMIDRGTPTAAGELERGVVIGRHSLGDEYLDIAEATFSLGVGEVSDVVYIYTANEGGRYYIIYRAEKTDDFLRDNYGEVVTAFLYDSVGKMLGDISTLLNDGVRYADGYAQIEHSAISMDE